MLSSLFTLGAMRQFEKAMYDWNKWDSFYYTGSRMIFLCKDHPKIFTQCNLWIKYIHTVISDLHHSAVSLGRLKLNRPLLLAQGARPVYLRTFGPMCWSSCCNGQMSNDAFSSHQCSRGGGLYAAVCSNVPRFMSTRRVFNVKKVEFDL